MVSFFELAGRERNKSSPEKCPNRKPTFGLVTGGISVVVGCSGGESRLHGRRDCTMCSIVSGTDGRARNVVEIVQEIFDVDGSLHVSVDLR